MDSSTDQKDRSSRAKSSALFHEGFLKTGDLVRRDSDQDFYVVGRKKEMFISGGENVYPTEVENVVATHPDVSEVAVVGVVDSQWGEVGRPFYF